MHNRINDWYGKNAVTGVFPFINKYIRGYTMAIPEQCRGIAQKVADIANERIRNLKQKHSEHMMDAERHIGLLHNSMERVVNAKSPQHASRALNAMKDMYTGTVHGRSTKTNQFVNPSEHAGKVYGSQKNTNMKILATQVKDLIKSKLKRNKK